MKTVLGTTLMALAFLTNSADAAPSKPADLKSLKAGEAAPAFSLPDSHGKRHTLEQNKGKWVVLEWLNHGCPFVKKHYESGNMQKLQKKYTQAEDSKKRVVWYSVISSAPGTQGFSTPDEANADVKKHGAAPTAVLLDTDGVTGKLYGAQTTPYMVVINPQGIVTYFGAIDDKPTTEIADIPSAKNYLSAAIDTAQSGGKVAVASTKSYGCSVKYKN